MANDKELQKALKSAFDVCFTVSDAMGNIIAGSEVPGKIYLEMKEQADTYIKWYLKTFNQPAI